jgi:UDP-N-acetylmuramate dehydrogenase
VTDLAGYTTLGLGGPARSFVTASATDQLIEAVRAADAAGEPVLLLGGGSNLVVSDDGFPGTVIHVNTRGVSYAYAGDGHVAVTVEAGEDWDDVVAATVTEGLAGLECLSGIPGRAGATPIQNVGAYGQEVAEVIAGVRVFDRLTGETAIIPNERCCFSYRNSIFKSGGFGGSSPRASRAKSGGAGESFAAPGASEAKSPSLTSSSNNSKIQGERRYVVTGATFRLLREDLSRPVRYAELASELGVEMGERVSVTDARSAVIKIRARKGMLLNPGDPDSRSAGSFFTNPVLSAEQFARLEASVAGPVPRFDAGQGQVKVPAAWLIEHAGFGKGNGAPGRARISSKHTLALVNAGGATTADLLALAREIRAGVRAAFGVTLDPEPILVGVTL